MDLLQRITENLSQFSKSERKVADITTGNPESVIHTSIANMAAIADVSEPTVNRFCRRLGCKGFPDFKLKLAQSLAKGTPFLNRHVEENDSVDELTNKIFDSTLAALNIARQQLDSKPIETAIDALIKAPKIAFFGFGASASVAHDAQNKFARFDTPSVFSDDLLMQRMWAINSKPNDVLFAISHTGRTKALCEIAEIAQQNGATVIGITTINSPLAEFCNDIVSSNVPEDTDQYMPMASRIAHLVLIDAIIAGYTLKRGAEVREKLARIKQGLKGSRFPRR
ncbi:MAG: transcriptional regulator HexR [Pseudomonadota bacterium]